MVSAIQNALSLDESKATSVSYNAVYSSPYKGSDLEISEYSGARREESRADVAEWAAWGPLRNSTTWVTAGCGGCGGGGVAVAALTAFVRRWCDCSAAPRHAAHRTPPWYFFVFLLAFMVDLDAPTPRPRIVPGAHFQTDTLYFIRHKYRLHQPLSLWANRLVAREGRKNNYL